MTKKNRITNSSGFTPSEILKNSIGGKQRNQKFQAGFGLVEILVAVAIIGLSLAALTELGNLALKISLQTKKNVVAVNLANEALEAAKAAKQESWDNLNGLTIGSPYHPIKTGSPLKWAFASGEESVNGFARQITLSDVYRDNNDDIVDSGGTLDSNTKKITTIVAWSDNGQNYQTTLISYLTNWKP